MEEFKRALIAMFGFIWTQPIHVTLRNMRIVQVWLVYESVGILKSIVLYLRTVDDPMQVAIAYGAIAAGLIAGILSGVGGLHKSNNRDE